ncbi:hypothetical protein [Sphingobacterium kyonggiense]
MRNLLSLSVLFFILGICSCSKSEVAPSEFKLVSSVRAPNCGTTKVTFTKDYILRDISQSKCVPYILFNLKDTLSTDQYDKIISYIEKLNLLTLKQSTQVTSNDTPEMEILIEYKGKRNKIAFRLPVVSDNELKYKEFVDYIESRFYK